MTWLTVGLSLGVCLFDLATGAGGSPVKNEKTHVATNLADLRDAYGLALLVTDDDAAAKLRPLLATWKDKYKQPLTQNPKIKAFDQRTEKLFKDNLAGRTTPSKRLQRVVAAIPKEQMAYTLSLWLKSLFHRSQVYFPNDLKQLDKKELANLCTESQAMIERKDLSSWRYRTLLWKWRDSQVVQAFEQRDQHLASLTPIQLALAQLEEETANSLQRYLKLLKNLKVQLEANKELPYEKHRTLKGLLNGLRYMKTIRKASELTNLPHKLMTALFIQESEFIHHRVSVAGAFSVAQFLNIAIRDVWQFRKKIKGSNKILAGIRSSTQLRDKMIRNPRMAIRTAFLYFRRVRDYIAGRVRLSLSRNTKLVNLIAMEMFTAKRSLMRQSYTQAMLGVSQSMEEEIIDTIFSVPIAGIVVPEPSALMSNWIMRTIQDTLQDRIATQMFENRMDTLIAALGLASYNAGIGNVNKMAQFKGAFAALSFPLQIDETRGYVDSILDARNILANVRTLGSEIELLDFNGLVKLSNKTCSLSKIKNSNSS